MTSLEIPASVTNLGSAAFYSCSGLTSVILPSSITEIKDYTFAYCWNLTTLDIPRTVTTIGDCAFYDCSELTSLTCRAAIPPVVYNDDVFIESFESATLYVPVSAVDAYKAADVWKNFASIVGFEDEIVAGDVDGNGKVDVADITALIDVMLLGTGAGNPAADVDGNGVVNVADITALIDYLLLH